MLNKELEEEGNADVITIWSSNISHQHTVT